MQFICAGFLFGAPGMIYIGVTSDLFGRVAVHKQDLVDGFTKKYSVHMLVYYEMHETMAQAIARETRLKKWKRAWKVRLIHAMNPEWLDLFDERNGGISDGPADRTRPAIDRAPVAGSSWMAAEFPRPGRRCGASLRDDALSRRGHDVDG